ncbi:hypothetical protein [Wukongibacter sp. M2B1]|uniref:hypothetical protein n=1 Tax=Wukongibacter sp. M2B1 TaxID=3088895 RepID=UPI003D798ECA
MNRVEKMKTKKHNRVKRIKRFFTGIVSFILLLTLLYIGLEIVDETNRTMMFMEDSSFFSYNRLNKDNVEVVFCGDRYLVNVERIDAYIFTAKEKTSYSIEKVKEFAENKGKIVAKLVEDIF